MTDERDWQEPLSELELWVRSAGNYVQASSDLRPRVLESVREQRGERRVRKYLRRASLCILLALFSFVSIRQARQSFETNEDALLGNGTVGGDVSWGTVEAFTEVRRQQAKVLRSSL